MSLQFSFRQIAMMSIFLVYIGPVSTAFAGAYEVNVTRKAANIYAVTGKNIKIVTRYCYEYQYYADAILKMVGQSGRLIFAEGNAGCDVKGVYGPVEVRSGSYVVTINRESDDWYEVFGKGVFIQTSSCINLALGEEATLILSPSGNGKIIFDSGSTCLVEGLYSRLSL